MKKVLLLLLVVASLLAFTACSSEKATNENDVTPTVEASQKEEIKATSTPVPTATPAIEDEGDDLIDDTENQVTIEPTPVATVELPEKFDLRYDFKTPDGVSHNVISPVKFQNPFGTCWGFAAIAAAEASMQSELLYNGWINGDKFIDLSEKHLAWFAYSSIPEEEGMADPEHPAGYYDKDGIWQGEGVHTIPGDTSNERLDLGGMPSYGVNLFSTGVGPQFEIFYPYKNEEDAVVVFADAEKSKMEVVQLSSEELEALTPEEKEKVYCYAKTLDVDGFSGENDATWALPDEARYGTAFILENSAILPDPRVFDEEGNYEGINEDAIRAIKEEIIAGRAVSFAFHADQSQPNEDNPGWYSQYTKDGILTHYTYDGVPGTGSITHAVTIVGWDDTFEKENFIVDPNTLQGPAGDGAWIVKNSWGSEDSDSAIKGGFGTLNEKGEKAGYFHLSYYDTSFCLAESFDFDTREYGRSSELKAYIVNNYTNMISPSYEHINTSDVLSTANVFTAACDMVLESIAYQSAGYNSTVKYEVYLLEKDAETPVDGQKVLEFSTFHKNAGFHREFFEDYDELKDLRIEIKEGQNYSVVVTEKSADDDCYHISFSKGPGPRDAFTDKEIEECYEAANLKLKQQLLIGLYPQIKQSLLESNPEFAENPIIFHQLILMKFEDSYEEKIKPLYQSKIEEMVESMINSALTYYPIGVINQNESFVFLEGDWYDQLELIADLMENIPEYTAYNFQFDNFPIRTYSCPIE